MLQMQIRDAGDSSSFPPKVVIADCLKNSSQSALADFPNVNHLKQNVKNIRAKTCDNPKLPRKREDIVILKKYKQTARGKDFVLFDSSVADDHILMFGTQKNLRVLQNYKCWLLVTRYTACVGGCLL